MKVRPGLPDTKKLKGQISDLRSQKIITNYVQIKKSKYFRSQISPLANLAGLKFFFVAQRAIICKNAQLQLYSLEFLSRGHVK